MEVKEKTKQSFIGTDVSKLTLDVSIINQDGTHGYTGDTDPPFRPY
jgi:hypothetical protein